MIYHKDTIKLHPEWKDEDAEEIKEMERAIYIFLSSYTSDEIVIGMKSMLKTYKEDYKNNYKEVV